MPKIIRIKTSYINICEKFARMCELRYLISPYYQIIKYRRDTHLSWYFGSIAFDHLYTFDGAIRDFLATQDSKNISISLFVKITLCKTVAVVATLPIRTFVWHSIDTLGRTAKTHTYMNRLKTRRLH